MKDITNLLNELATKYNVSVRIDENGPEDQAFILGGDEIVIGKYEDSELALISFFHELGHATQADYYKYNYGTFLCELDCWYRGIHLARHEHNIIFTDKAIKWGYEQAMLYAGHDEREFVNWKETDFPKLWINQR